MSNNSAKNYQRVGKEVFGNIANLRALDKGDDVHYEVMQVSYPQGTSFLVVFNDPRILQVIETALALHAGNGVVQ